jgi:hypothetical protein
MESETAIAALRNKNLWLGGLALVRCDLGCAAVGIRYYPGTGRQRRREDSLAPLVGVFGARRHDGYPHQQREHTYLKRRERGRQAWIHADEHRRGRTEEGTAREIRPGQMQWQPGTSAAVCLA